MKVLFLHPNQQDYLADSLFHGLRTLLGENCVDVPRYDCMYAPIPDALRTKLRGNGFTLYGLLEDLPELTAERHFWQKDLPAYDLVVIANIWAQWRLAQELLLSVKPHQLAVLDGQDAPAIFPYALHLRNQPWAYLFQLNKVIYFKRELMGEGHSYRLEQFLSNSLRKGMRAPSSVKPIAFSIPEEKISVPDAAVRPRNFPTHIVDEEVARQDDRAFFSAIGSDQQAFADEAAYYDDLKQARFGITTKRGGWDCLRHYELAANGCVLCFRDLDHKPLSCAPHGLDQTNCLVYHNYDELRSKINSLDTEEYAALREGNSCWIRRNTTTARAREFLVHCGF